MADIEQQMEQFDAAMIAAGFHKPERGGFTKTGCYLWQRDADRFLGFQLAALASQPLNELSGNSGQLHPAPAAAVPEGMKLVPTEPTPEIIAAVAVAVWPTASPSDVAMARVAAQAVLMEMDTAPGVTIDVLAGILATMAPAYRAMVAAAPAPEVSR